MMIQLYIDICQKIQLSRQDITEKNYSRADIGCGANWNAGIEHV